MKLIPEQKKVFLKRPVSSGRPAPMPLPQKPKASRFGFVVALAAGIWIGYTVGSGRHLQVLGAVRGNAIAGLANMGKAAALPSAPQSARMTKEQWKERLNENYLVRQNVIELNKTKKETKNEMALTDDFKRIMGKPDHTQTVGGQTFWYYTCSDGQMQLVVSSAQIENGWIAGAEVNDY